MLRPGSTELALLGSCGLALLQFLAPVAVAQSSLGNPIALAEKFEGLLLPQPEDYQADGHAAAAFKGSLLPLFNRTLRNVKAFEHVWPGEPAFFSQRSREVRPPTPEELEIAKSNAPLRRFVLDLLPKLAFSYRVPGTEDTPNPHYQNPEILALYIAGLEHAYSRGITEEAWLPDHAGRASADALEAGLTRPSGDVSELSLRFGAFVQSIFLMRESLAAVGLLDKYRAVARNLAVNNGTMYPAFFLVAREEAGIQYPNPLPLDQRYHLNADAMRLFADSFWPYFLLIEDPHERSQMSLIVSQVIAANVAVKPGVQGVIKPDGTGFHHATAYVGAYTPGAFEAAAQLVYLAKDTTNIKPENVEAVKLALEAYRVMVQRYSVSSSLRGRLIRGNGLGVTDQIAKAMAFLGHPEGADDFDMRARFHEFFDEGQFLAEDRDKAFFEGGRGTAIRGMGIYRLINDLLACDYPPAEQPSGVWVKPYAAAAFFRRDDWLVTAKGFSQYFWDYEANINGKENGFGQNWAYGLLQVFSAGDPISEAGSGNDLTGGWDWYHVPGTTASHYPVRKYNEGALKGLRKRMGILQRDTHRNYNTKTFVGGVTLGTHGFFVQELEAVPYTSPTDLQARKTYFFMGDRVLALGTHISGGTEEDQTHTTLFQTRLADSDSPTWLDGTQLTGLDTSLRIAAGNSAAMVDSVGNSYYLAHSTSDLMVTRMLQETLTNEYESGEGAFAKAYLNHGTKPSGDSYQYVLIPSDPDGAKLRQTEADPGAFYEVVESDRIHLVRFPQHDVTAYAFYELVETPADELVRQVSLQAAVITESVGYQVRLAASVPDIGWTFGATIGQQGLSYTNKQFARQQAKVHDLELVLRGRWQIDQGPESAASQLVGEETVVSMQATDGLSSEILLSPAPPSRQ